MRLYLLPISTRRTLLYCQKLQKLPQEKQTWLDWGTVKAVKLWSDWEQKDSGWQKKVVDYGNKALRKIPYEEWGLKSVPPLSTRRREEEILGKEKHHLYFPESIIPPTKATDLLRRLSTERESLHKSRLIWCFVGMPISAPFALVPVIPNLPFFYLVYRAWSHWRALAGGRHLQWLVQNKFLTLSSSPVLNTIYPSLLPRATSQDQSAAESKWELPSSNDTNVEGKEKMVLTQASGRQLAKALELPQLEVELERAIWQVENDIQKEKEEKSR
ncbi:mitochondrial K+-H+ exchange-related-domain-containing protein [Xylariaceae sp. FL0016]|nr:mitochondrial K+-H+ exchange-related-domain-containing protein [Xylariaceae sp. FL0016]